MPIANRNCECCAPACRPPRRRHAAPAAASTKMPKKRPVTSSHNTPPRRAVGSHTARPNRRPPSTTPRRVSTAAGVREDTGRSGALRGDAGRGVCAGGTTLPTLAAPAFERGGVAAPAISDARGLGAVAASTAPTSVFAALRAPTPSTRPSRLLSIPSQFNRAVRFALPAEHTLFRQRNILIARSLPPPPRLSRPCLPPFFLHQKWKKGTAARHAYCGKELVLIPRTTLGDCVHEESFPSFLRRLRCCRRLPDVEQTKACSR